MNLILDTHIIQSYPVSNLNRDDTGSPKDCIVGGSRRARVSSQCVKRSIRMHKAFSSRVEQAGGDIGVRTKFLLNELSSSLAKRGLDAQVSEQTARAGILALGFAFDKKRQDKTEYLLYIGKREMEDIVTLLMDEAKRTIILEAVEKIAGKGKKQGKKNESEDIADVDDEPNSKKEIPLDKYLKKELTDIIGSERKARGGYAADIALFGRMVADAKDMNVDGASQVAHAFSTHRVDTTFDYYTAVDDRNSEDAGAGMVGIQEYNSACYYRYANVSSASLIDGLGGDKKMAVAALVGFAEATALAIPTGKQHSTAAVTRPSYIRYVVRRNSAPLSYAGAFSCEIKPPLDGSKTIEGLSITALKAHESRLNRIYGTSDIVAVFEVNLEDDGSQSLSEALAGLEACLAKELEA